MTDFQQKLWITIIDKGILGLLVALFGYIINRAIENFKSKKVLDNEIEKKKIEKIQEVYEALADFENCITDILLNRMLIQQIIARYITVMHQSNDMNKEIIIDFNNIKKQLYNLQNEIGSISRQHMDKLSKLETELDAKKFSYFDILQRNRFWINKRQYKIFQDFFGKLSKQGKQEFDNFDIDQFKEELDFRRNIMENRLDINDMFKN